MKKQINPTIKAHLIRGAFYLLLLVAVCAIPFALAQRNTIKRSVATTENKSKMATKLARAARASGPAQATMLAGVHQKAASQSSADSQLRAYDVRPAPFLPRLSQVPQKSSGAGGAHVIPMLRPPKA